MLKTFIMIGDWKGSYEFDDNGLTVKTNFDRTSFSLFLESINDGKVYGSIQEDVTNTIKDDFSMIGSIRNERIVFTKFKSTQPVRNPEDFDKFKYKHGPIIYYQGSLSPNKKEVIGTWKFKLVIQLLWGFIPFPYSRGKGTWSMRFQEST